MLLALNNWVDTNWDTVWWSIGSLAAVGALLFTILAFRRESLRIGVWGFVSTLVLCTVLAVTWHYFGWETEYTDTGFSIKRHRVFGRVTLLAWDTNGDGWADAKYSYRFSEPWAADRQYEPYFESAKEDRNYDGQWDTWWTPTDTIVDGEPLVLLEADTNLDGQPDFQSEESMTAPSTRYAEVQRIRGF